MSQHYSDESREQDEHALPDVEVFLAHYADCPHCTTTNARDGLGEFHCDSCSKGRKGYRPEPEDIRTGWFWWTCFPGCLPDSEPFGPFTSEQAAIDDAQKSASE